MALKVFFRGGFFIITKEETDWEDIKHIILALLNDHYSNGKELILDQKPKIADLKNLKEVEKQIIKILKLK